MFSWARRAILLGQAARHSFGDSRPQCPSQGAPPNGEPLILAFHFDTLGLKPQGRSRPLQRGGFTWKGLEGFSAGLENANPGAA
eukprot:3687200-Prymnesium_polylepis.1